MMRLIRNATTGSKTLIVKFPYKLIDIGLGLWGLIHKNPPFTRQQLAYLVADYIYEIKDWQDLFGVKATPFRDAIEETYKHIIYSKINLKF